MKSVKIAKLLKDLKVKLKQIYGKNLEMIILFGSFARGTQTKNSDIDVAMILNNKVNPCKEIDKTAEIVSDLSMFYNELISIYPLSAQKFDNINSTLIKNIKKYGLVL